MRYIQYTKTDPAQEFADVLRDRASCGIEEVVDEVIALLGDLQKVDSGELKPKELGEPIAGHAGLFTYSSWTSANWPGEIGVWLAFLHDDDGLMIVYASLDFTGKDIPEHQRCLNEALRRLALIKGTSE